MAAGGNRTSENRSAYDPSVDAVKVISAGTASDGSALPANFDSLPYASTTTWGTDGYPTQKVEVVTAPGATYTKTTIYTANGTNPPNKSDGGWVKS